MSRPLRILLLALALTAAMSPSAVLAATQVTPGGIVVGVLDLDGESVTFEGEAIGDVLHGDDGHVWVNVLGDDAVAIGVWIDGSGPVSPREAISVLGEYDAIGDRVRIEGTVNAACDRHGGDLDVHATSFAVVSTGTPVEHEPDPLVGILGLGLLAAAGVLTFVYRRGELTPLRGS